MKMERALASRLNGFLAGLKVVDFSFFEFSSLFNEKGEQIARVEENSDAYHLTFGESEVMVAYLLEIKRKG